MKLVKGDMSCNQSCALVTLADALVQNGGKNQLWVLKQDVHRGKGVHVMKEGEAINEVQKCNHYNENLHLYLNKCPLILQAGALPYGLHMGLHTHCQHLLPHCHRLTSSLLLHDLAVSHR